MRVSEVFRRGINVTLEIVRNNETIEVPSTVAYGLPPNVMGLSFGELTSEKRALLTRWIEQAVPTLRRTTPSLETPAHDHVGVSSNVGDTKKPQ